MKLASRRSLKCAAAFAVALAIAGIGVSAVGARSAPASKVATPPSPEAVQALIASIDAQIAKIGANGSIDDYQGAIAFAVDQSKAECNVVIAALKTLLARQNIGKGQNKALVRAINNVMNNCGGAGTGGTGGIGGNQNGFSGLGLGPSVGGGGSSNYSNP